VADDWLEHARAYRQRTGDEMRDVYLALLFFVGRDHPRVMAEALRGLEGLYPDGIAAGPRNSRAVPPKEATDG
jgi:hypothetical protein